MATSKPAPSRARLLVLSEEVRQILVTELAPEAEDLPRLKRAKTSTLRKLSFTRLESLQRLGELACWLVLYGVGRQGAGCRPIRVGVSVRWRLHAVRLAAGPRSPGNRRGP